MSFYTYMHTRADDGQVFYIGKGKDRRAWSAGGRSAWWRNVVQKHGVSVQVLAHWDDEVSAFEHEVLLIDIFRERGAPLVNLTRGGEGASGVTPSEETRSRISKSLTGLKRSEHFRAQISVRNKGRQVSDQTRRRISDAQRGRVLNDEWRKNISAAAARSQFKRGPHTDEAKEKMRQAKLGNKLSEEHKDRIAQSLLGGKRTEEQRARMSEAAKKRVCPPPSPGAIAARAAANRGKKRSEETKSRMSAAQKLRFAKREQQHG